MNLLPHGSAAPTWRRRRPHPALPQRVIHIDLKGPKLALPVFKQLLRLYARWGISAVLVEYEQRLPALPWPRQFAKSERYTQAEIAELVGLSRRLGLEYIPFVPMLGHVEYLRHLPGTARLMEQPVYPSQLCPSRPAVRAYLERLIASLCELHPHSRYLFVGLDEAQQLGHCPACRRRAAQLGGKLELYLDHARWVSAQVLQRGRVPLMAGDMLLGTGHANLIERLDPRVVVTPWDYSGTAERAAFMLFKGQRPCKAALRHDATGERWPANLPAFPRPGGLADDLPAGDLRKLGGLGRSLGQVHLMAQLDRPLWGICAASCSSDGRFHPDFARGFHNCRQMIRTLRALKGQAVVATAWARGHSFAPINSMWPLGLYGLARFAAMSWSGRTSAAESTRDLPGIAAELGVPARFGEWTLEDVLWILSNPTRGGPGARAATLRNLRDLLARSRGRGAFFEGLQLAIDLELHGQELAFLLEEVRWWQPNRRLVPPLIKTEMRQRRKRFQHESKHLKTATRRYYRRWVGDQRAFAIWWRGLFEVDSALTVRALELI